MVSVAYFDVKPAVFNSAIDKYVHNEQFHQSGNHECGSIYRTGSSQVSNSCGEIHVIAVGELTHWASFPVCVCARARVCVCVYCVCLCLRL